MLDKWTHVGFEARFHITLFCCKRNKNPETLFHRYILWCKDLVNVEKKIFCIDAASIIGLRTLFGIWLLLITPDVFYS